MGLKVVVIGGVAAGPKIAAKVMRLMPDAETTIIQKDPFMSYAGCGFPYYVSGAVKEQKDLLATPAGVVRDAGFFQKVKNVRVMGQTEAVEIDRAGKRVRVRDLLSEMESWIAYDKLALATGASPVKPPLPGMSLKNISTLHNVSDAENIKAMLSAEKGLRVVIVGGGLIGVETAEALVAAGCNVTLVEMLPQILPMLDGEIAQLVAQHIRAKGVNVMTDTRVQEFKGGPAVSEVLTDKGVLPADAVILSVGVRPNTALAAKAGLKIGPTKAIAVNDHMQTSDPDIYAAGDCVECRNLITGEPCYVPLGSTANKQGRVAAINICGGNDVFPGILGSTVCKVFDYCVARTGLSESEAIKAGYDVATIMAPGPDKAHYMPGVKPLLMKLVMDAKTRRLLGMQAVGPGAGDKRADAAAVAITAGMTVDQIANLDLCYAPPYSPAMDNLITAANVARNKLDGVMVSIAPGDVHAMQERGEDFVFLDVRSPAEIEKASLRNTVNIPLGTLRGRLKELPEGKPIVAFCAVSLRGYEAALILKAAGFKDVRVMDGGIAMWPFEKLV